MREWRRLSLQYDCGTGRSGRTVQSSEYFGDASHVLKRVFVRAIDGDLPSQRVIPARPFSSAGIDFYGPFAQVYERTPPR